MGKRVIPVLVGGAAMPRAESLLDSTAIGDDIAADFHPVAVELDSPRGRIYLIKDMLEKNRPADALTVKHIDRCLSCLACMTASRPGGGSTRRSKNSGDSKTPTREWAPKPA
jgi:hypothetical protein